MSDLDPAAVEAVAKATWEFRHNDTPWDAVRGVVRTLLLREAEAAIRAYQAHRAAQVRDGLNNLLDKAGEYYLERSGSRKEESLYQEARALKAALLALVGAQEEPSDV